MTSHRRRTFLAGVGSASALALAGCVGDDEPTQTADGGGGETLDTHPAAVDAAEWPLLGPELGSADGTLIVFDDVSCPRCAAFHDETLSTIRADHVDSGEVSLVARPYPVVYDWGGPAAHALEATYNRDAEAFWELQAHYFDEQGEFDADNVLDRTESWLEANTSLDAESVVDDAENGQFDDRIQSTLDAGEATDAVSRIVDDVVLQITTAYPAVEVSTSVPSAATASVSPEALETVLFNLADNAVEHNDSVQPLVVISVDSETDRLRIAVSDNGPGIPNHELAVLEAGGEDQLDHGSGLGLWAVNWGITQMDGTFSVSENEPRGTTVTISLPATAAEPTAEDEMGQMAAPAVD